MASKTTCILLSIALTFHTGCYATRTSRTLENPEVRTHPLKESARVLVYYLNNQDQPTEQRGKIYDISEDTLTIRYGTYLIPIAINRISQIDLLDRDYDIAASIFLVAGAGITALLLVAAFLYGIGYPPGGD